MVAADCVDTTRSGRIVFLNGTSSSGKSSIAEHLLLMLDRPYYMSVDAINAMRAKAQTAELDSVGLDRVLRRTPMGFHRAIAGMAWAGNDLVVDYVLGELWRMADCLDVWAGLDVVLIGVRCSLDELERRERARGDRESWPGGQSVVDRLRRTWRKSMHMDATISRLTPRLMIRRAARRGSWTIWHGTRFAWA